MKKSRLKLFFIVVAAGVLGLGSLTGADWAWLNFGPYRDGWPSRAHPSGLHSAVIADDLAAVMKVAPWQSDAQEQLYYARSTAMAEYLISRGASVTARRYGFTPLHFAAALGSEEVAAVLVRHGADVNAVTESGETPLMRAVFVSVGDPDEGFDLTGYDKSDARWLGITRYLITAGSDVRHCDTAGRTALGIAMFGGHAHDVAKALIDAGADVNSRTSDDSTPLHGAACEADLETVRLLLEHGADPNVQDKWEHKRPLDLVPEDRAETEEVRRLLSAK